MKRSFIFEGLDGSGKTTLVQGISLRTGIPIIPRLSIVEDTRIKSLIDEGISVDEIHKLYMAATHMHLVDVILPKMRSGEIFLIDKWLAGMLTAHVLREGSLADWAVQNYDWSSVKEVDCIFVRTATEIRKQRAMNRGPLSKSDEASFLENAETIHFRFAKMFYQRTIVLEATNLSKDELLVEALRVLDI